MGLLGVLAYHVMMCTTSFFTYGFQPFPPLPAEFEAVMHPYEDKQFFGDKNSRRVASWHNLRTTSPDLFASLPLNMPDYYQVPSIFGYDPLVEGQPRRGGDVQSPGEESTGGVQGLWSGIAYFQLP